MAEAGTLPIWNPTDFPPIVNHRDPEQLSGHTTFTRIAFVDVPPTIPTLESAIAIYEAEAVQLAEFGIHIPRHTRVLLPTRDAETVIAELPAFGRQHLHHGGTLLTEEYYLGTVVPAMVINIEPRGDVVSNAVHAYSVTGLRSKERDYVIGDLRGNQVTRNFTGLDVPEATKGVLFDVDLVLRKTLAF